MKANFDEAKGIRWQQRFSNFSKAMKQLRAAVGHKEYSELERQGLIQCFEYTIELAWKTLQDLLEAKGYTVRGPKPVVHQAFEDGYIVDGDAWAEMLDSRNLTSHTYEELVAMQIADKIQYEYFAMLETLESRLKAEI